MQRISAHLPAAIKHLRWAYLSLIALLASLVSTQAHAAVRPATDAPDLHSSRDGVLSRLAARIAVTARTSTDRALALHKVRAGESMSADAVRYCHGHAEDWTGIYAESRAEHLTAANANVLTVGQFLAIDCRYLPGKLKYAPHPHPHTVTTAYVARSGGHHDPFDGNTQYGCGDGDGDGAHDMPCSLLHHHYATASSGYRHYGRSHRVVSVYRGRSYSSSRYSGNGGCQSHIIRDESGGNARAVNPASGAGGLYQFLPSTWHALGHSGLPQYASVAEQNQAYHQQVSQSGYSAWSASGGC